MATELEEAQVSRLEASLPTSLYATLKRAAELQGRTVPEFVIKAAQDAAQRELLSPEIITLSAEAQRRFVEALIQPPAPGVALRRAQQLHHANVEVR